MEWWDQWVGSKIDHVLFRQNSMKVKIGVIRLITI